MIYKLHPDIGLRNDIDRNILYVKNPGDSDFPDFVQTVNTPAAVLLALLDGTRGLQDAIALWSELVFGRPYGGWLASSIERILRVELTPGVFIKDLFLKLDNEATDGFPAESLKSLIIKKEQLNLDDPRLRIPLRLLFIPTLRCTQHCYYCYSNDRLEGDGGDFNLDRIKEVFSEAKGLGIETIDLSGGEVFSYKEIFDLLEFFHENGMTANIPTKYPLSLEEIRRLKELGIRSLQVSIDAITPELLNATVGVDGYAGRIKKTFIFLESEGIRVRINTVITSKNAEETINLARFLSSYKNIYKITLSPYSISRFRHNDDYYLTPEKYSTVKNKFNEIFADRSDVILSPGDLPLDPIAMPLDIKRDVWKNRSFCSGGRHGFALLPDGRVTMCEELYYHPHYIIGDLKTQSIMEMWGSASAKKISSPDRADFKGSHCEICGDFESCHIAPGRCVREAIKIYGAERHFYPDPRCPSAPAPF